MTAEPKKGTSRRAFYVGLILVLVVIIAGLVFLLLRGGLNPTPTADLKITRFERNYVTKTEISGGDFLWSWIVNLDIKNTGSIWVDGADLVVELKADNTTISSFSDKIWLSAGRTFTVPTSVNAKESEWLGKDVRFVATIYYDNHVIDQYTTDWVS